MQHQLQSPITMAHKIFDHIVDQNIWRSHRRRLSLPAAKPNKLFGQHCSPRTTGRPTWPACAPAQPRRASPPGSVPAQPSRHARPPRCPPGLAARASPSGGTGQAAAEYNRASAPGKVEARGGTVGAVYSPPPWEKFTHIVLSRTPYSHICTFSQLKYLQEIRPRPSPR